MNKTRSMMKCMIAGAIALAMVTTLSAQSAGDRVAKVIRIKGAARYSTGNNVFQPLEVGVLLRPGAVIQTAADSYVDLALDESTRPVTFGEGGPGFTYRPTADRDVVRLFADSVLAIDTLTQTGTGIDTVTKTELDLRSGKIFGSVKKLSKGSEYLVKIPNGVAGIRGTTYTISADGGVITVYEGTVVVSWTVIGPNGQPSEQTQVIQAGFQFSTQTGQMTPITMPPSGQPPAPGPTVFVSPNPIIHINTEEIFAVQGLPLPVVPPSPPPVSGFVAQELRPNLAPNQSAGTLSMQSDGASVTALQAP